MDNPTKRDVFSLRLPNSTREDAERLAQDLGISFTSLILQAVEEKMLRLNFRADNDNPNAHSTLIQ